MTAEEGDVGTAAAPGRGLSLGARIFLATALLVAATVGVAVALTYLIGQRIAEDAVDDALERTAAVQAAFQEQRLGELRLIARNLVGDPPFVAYVAESLDSGDTLSLLDQLEERQRDLGSDFAMVLDPDGRLVAATGAFLEAGTDLSAEPLVEEALESFEAAGAWARGERLFQVVAVPIVQVDVLLGFLVAGFAIDDRTALELRRVGEADVAFLVFDQGRPELVASTLDPGRAEAFLTALAAAPPAGVDERGYRFELGGEPWLGLSQPLLDAAGRGSVGSVVTLASIAARRAPFERIGKSLLAVGLGAVLLALAVSYLLSRRLLRPVRRLSAAAQAAAEGDYEQRIAVDRGDEVGRLARSFDVLLAQLREKRDMELYLGELAKSVPEAAPAMMATGTHALGEDRLVALLGVELRSPGDVAGAADADLVAGGAPAAVLDRLTATQRRVADVVAAHGGAVESVVGGRLLASFAGEQRTGRALAAAGAIRGVESGVAMTLARGRLVAGEVTWGRRPRRVVAGGVVQELERLLRVTKPGDLLVARSAFGELEELYRRAGEALEDEPGFAATLPLFALDVDSAARLTGHDAQATWAAVEPDAGNGLGGVVPGQVIGGRFEILATLGSGGMGVVYKAHDRELDEPVAVKMIKSSAVDAEQLARLKSELKLARRITHPNVLRTYDFGEVDGIPFITMEYVRGITLRQLLSRSGRLPLSAGLHLARQLCRGLEVAHDEGVLHRDIKPENLLVEPAGNAKLMDFGIARPMRRKTGETRPGAIVGTPVYLAPEQLQGDEPDVRADVYACGVVFYELFTGELPFDVAGKLMEVLRRKIEQDPVPPRHHWPSIPPALEAILLRCLARDREERYPDVRALRRELEAVRA